MTPIPVAYNIRPDFNFLSSGFQFVAVRFSDEAGLFTVPVVETNPRE